MDKNEERRLAKIKRFERKIIETKQIEEYFESKENNESLIKNISKLSQEDKNILMKNICINKAGTIEDIEILMSFGAKVDETNSANAFTLSCSHNRKDVLEYFLNNGFKHQNSINIGFRKACIYGRVLFADLLLRNNADINFEDGKSFLYACQGNHYEMVDFLIKNGANVQDGKPLIYACANNNINITKLLLDNNANVHVQDEKPLAFALRDVNENENLVQLLENYGANKANMKHKFDKKIYSFDQMKISEEKKESLKLAHKLSRFLGSAVENLKAPQLAPPKRNFKFEKFLQLHIFNYLKENNVELEPNKIIKKMKI